MYESVVVLENSGYGNDIVTPHGKKKIVFNHSSKMHVTITAVDPATGHCVEVIIRKDKLPDFVTNPEDG